MPDINTDPLSPFSNNLTAASRIVDISRKLVFSGLNRNSSGNVSVRSPLSPRNIPGFLITPSGIPPSELTPSSICKMDMTGNLVGTGKPSSEWRIHRDIYLARPDVNAVIHTHSVFATILACMHIDVPAFHYMIAITGGNTIPCAPYALFGTQALSDAVLSKIANTGYACLLAHHGMIAIGTNLDHALSVAIETESLCEQYWHIYQTGHIKLLSDTQMKEVHEKFKDYFKK